MISGFFRWLRNLFEYEDEPGLPLARVTDVTVASAARTLTFLLANGESSPFPSCPRCLSGQGLMDGRRRAHAEMNTWAFVGTTPELAAETVSRAIPPCGTCLENFDSEQVYARVVALARAWATNGGSPLEIQAVLDATAKPLGVQAKRWI